MRGLVEGGKKLAKLYQTMLRGHAERPFVAWSARLQGRAVRELRLPAEAREDAEEVDSSNKHC
jgi:hypothetical protein